MVEPFMLYFGPLKESGHFLFYDNGEKVLYSEIETAGPWNLAEIESCLQPGVVLWRGHYVQRHQKVEGEALLHHKCGWTALSFWDSTIDTRPGCSSTYIAEGIFTFEEMVALAKARFLERWNKMKFEVRLAHTSAER